MFKLLIECTKDIEKLHIDFSDGTSVVQDAQPKSPKTPKKNNPGENKKEKPQDTRKFPNDVLLDDDYYNVNEAHESQRDAVQKPTIEERKQPPKVADELQNLDI